MSGLTHVLGQNVLNNLRHLQDIIVEGDSAPTTGGSTESAMDSRPPWIRALEKSATEWIEVLPVV